MARLRRLAASYAGSARASATLSAYASDWRDFERWCADAQRRALPASEETVCLYLVARLEDRRVSTVDRRFAAILDKHRREGAAVPSGQLVRDVMRGARRERPYSPVGNDRAVARAVCKQRQRARLALHDEWVARR